MKYHGASRFIDDLYAINDGNESLTSFENIHPKEVELKVKHQENHPLFFNLHIRIEDSIFVYKLFDKRDDFSFFTVPMLHLSSKIHSTVFFGSVFPELLCIARCTLRINDFIPIFIKLNVNKFP